MPLAPLPPLPSWIGHRGAAARAPENTLAALRRAADDGAAWVEFDLQASADGVAFLLHDPSLERTTDGSGAAAALRWAQLSALDAGAWFAPAFRGERIPSLAAALRCCAERGLGANLELKPAQGGAEELVAAVARVLHEGAAAGVAGLLLSSFDETALDAAARALPRIARGYLCAAPDPTTAARARALGCASVHALEASLDAGAVRALEVYGAAVLAYTVNDPVRARQLWDCGVAAVFTDDPARFRAGGGSPSRPRPAAPE